MLPRFLLGSVILFWGAPKSDAQAANAYNVGCADGTREWFFDRTLHPLIAGCSGCWDKPGFKVSNDVVNTAVTCGNKAGNAVGYTSCTGCSVGDVCAPGWHVCK